MLRDVKLDRFNNRQFIKKEDLIDCIINQTNYHKASSIRWIIHELVKDGKITKVNNDYYYNGRLKEYKPSYESEIKGKIKRLLEKKYSSIEGVIFESTLLNEWLNHQISQNVLFVQIDKSYSDLIFELIKEKTNHRVLYNPSVEDFYLYSENDMIIVSNMVSRSPNESNGYDIKLEKLVVDILSDDLVSEFISQSEIPDLIMEMFSNYKINTKTLRAYAKRRNKESLVLKYIHDYLPGR